MAGPRVRTEQDDPGGGLRGQSHRPPFFRRGRDDQPQPPRTERPRIGDDGYLDEQLLPAIEHGNVTESEWPQLAQIHELLARVARADRAAGGHA